MTNEQVVWKERVRPMEEGIIGTAGEKETVDELGNTTTVKVPDEIHTYQAWKSRGYQVRKGSKAVTKLRIWKYVDGREDENGRKEPDRHFMKTASFFCRSQVEEAQDSEKTDS